MTEVAAVPDLKPFFAPSSVGLVGATDDLSRFAGRVLMRMVNFGYQGQIWISLLVLKCKLMLKALEL